MNELTINFENCYGISKLSHKFDFSTKNVYSIYAPIGTMRTSFAKTEKGFNKILYKLETFIIYRFHFKQNLTKDWWEHFSSLPKSKAEDAKRIIEKNDFSNITTLSYDEEILKLLNYYTITREEAEKVFK